MTLLTVVRDVCAAVGVALPSTVFGGLQANRTMAEMLALANEMAQRIAYDTRDWTELRAYEAYGSSGGSGGNGGSARNLPGELPGTAFPLPANYKRMLLTSNVWSSLSPQQPLMFVPDTDEWAQRRLRGYADSRGEWTIYGGKLHIFPVVAAGGSVGFVYQDKNCITVASGGVGDRFMADEDSFRLDERLLKLGMIWQWMANKGSPYAEPMGTYSDALANAMGHDSPAPIIIGRSPISSTARVGASWPAGWGPP